jgi:hypothetical protein
LLMTALALGLGVRVGDGRGQGGHGDGMSGAAAVPGRLGFCLLAGVPNMEDVHPAQLLRHSRKLGLVCSLHLLRPAPETLNPRTGHRAATVSSPMAAPR